MRRTCLMLAVALLAWFAGAPASTAASAPPRPTGFAVAATGPTTIDLKWNASAGATTYRVWHGTNADGTKATLTTVSGTSARISGLTPNTTYYVDVAARNGSAQSAYTPKLAVTTTPATPTGLTVTATGTTTIDLRWNASAGATTYRVWHGTNADGTKATLTTVSGTSVRISGLTPGTRYYVDVAARTATTQSPYTSKLAVTTSTGQAGAPATPTGLAVTATGATTIDLKWNASAGATGYRVWHGTNADGTKATLTTTSGTSVRLSGLSTGTTYYVDVGATNAAGTSLYTPKVTTATTAPTRFDEWRGASDFNRGTLRGATVVNGALQIADPDQTMTYQDPYGSGSRAYEYATWTSPWQATGFNATTLVPSWNVSTDRTTWIQVDLRVRNASQTSSWDTAASWAWGVTSIHRHSMTEQADDLVRMEVDQLRANGSATFTEWQVAVKLLRPVGSSEQVKVRSIGGTASTFTTRSAATSSTTMTADRELAVPRYSQMIHRGQLPQFDGGGAAWCSPTSTSMVLRFWGSGPVASAYANEPSPDPWIKHAARNSYDHRYRGTGNWPFTAAYAGGYIDARVTRLWDLRDAETMIRAGIPVVASVAFGSGQLTGAPLSSTPGHLMVIVGFTKDGKVIANDPAAPANSSVRRVYDRAQFERAWLGGSGGVAYVITPTGHSLPTSPGRW